MIKFLLAVLIGMLIPNLSKAQYVCSPCNLACDTIQFKAPGICPHCRMALIPAPSVSNDSILHHIQKEARENSQVMRTVSFLSDVYGPRLMGTKNYFQALQWTQKTLESWGADQTYFHPFDRSHRSWELHAFSMEMSAPQYQRIRAFPAAYSSATSGVQEGEVLMIHDLNEVYALEGKLKGKILLLANNYYPVQNQFREMSRRFSDEILAEAGDNPDPNHRVIGYLSRRSIDFAIRFSRLRRKALQPFFEFTKKEGVLALIEASDFPYGILHVDGNRNFPTFLMQEDIQPVAAFVIANEDFGRLKRLMALGFSPKLKVDLQASFAYRPEYNQNLFARIEGQDSTLKEETLLIGGHFDSWHSGTGAVDNASGVATMMEAFRILKQLNLPLKRSVQLALWGGEEQIFAGSSAYVADSLGDIYQKGIKVDARKIYAYFNLDNGAGKIRGIYTMGNQGAAQLFKEILKPLAPDTNVTLQYANQTDHELFDRLNIPGFQLIQDPLDYMTAIHHTDVDVFEYVPEKDLQESAIWMAYILYQLANREEAFPQKQFNSPVPSREGNTVFQIAGYPKARQAQLIGTFNNWNLFGTAMYKTAQGWECRLELPPGEYLYKFYIDGDFIADPRTPKDQLEKDGKGHGGLTRIAVK